MTTDKSRVPGKIHPFFEEQIIKRAAKVNGRIFNAFCEKLKAAEIIKINRDETDDRKLWSQCHRVHVLCDLAFCAAVIPDKLGAIIEGGEYNVIDHRLEEATGKYNGFLKGSFNRMEECNKEGIEARNSSAEELNVILNQAIESVFPQKAKQKTAVERYVRDPEWLVNRP